MRPVRGDATDLQSRQAEERDLPTRDDVFAAVASIAERLGADRTWVFGSWAVGNPSRRSDVDVLVVEHTEEPFLARVERYLLPLTEAVGGMAVEVFVYTPEELDEMRERPFVRRALSEGVVVHGEGVIR